MYWRNRRRGKFAHIRYSKLLKERKKMMVRKRACALHCPLSKNERIKFCLVCRSLTHPPN